VQIPLARNNADVLFVTEMKRRAINTRAKRRWRFRGICADARALGVHRNSLYKVLAGIWNLKNLAARYAALKAEQVREAKPAMSKKTKI
jgi:hypothetical protein